MIESSSSETIELTEPLARIIKLHGEPFAPALDGTSFALGEPPARAALDLYVPRHIEELVERALELQSIYVPSGDYKVHQSQSKEIEAGFKEIVAESMRLSDEEFAIFDRALPIGVLSSLSTQLKSLPTYDQMLAMDDPGRQLGGFSHAIQSQLHLCSFLQSFAALSEERGEVGRIMAENFFHDALGHYCFLRDETGSFEHWPERLSSPAALSGLERVLDQQRTFVTNVLDANLAIARGQYPVDQCFAMEAMLPALSVNVIRFELELEINGETVIKGSKGTIRFKGDAEHIASCDPAAISLVVYNLVKNPIKGARMSMKNIPDVDVQVVPSSDKNCTSIFIRDSGVGFSYDELLNKFTVEALQKLEKGQKLNFVEECLIDEAMRDEIPFKALGSLLCNRGASARGGTGIGLALAKDIIEEGHQGAIRLYQHPTLGAGVQILLPNVDRTFNRAERKEITRESLSHQIHTGMPVAASAES